MFATFKVITSLFLVLALVLLAQVAFAWTGPSQAPTGGNVSAPINVGTTDQTKNGALGVNSLAVFGNTLLSGSSRYLNWGSTAGTSGYGIRDTAGTLEFKNSGGSWASFNTSVLNALTLNGMTLSSGTVTAAAFVYSSDARLKGSVQALTNGLEMIRALDPVSYVWTSGVQKGENDIGFLAQDVEKIIPSVVHTDSDGMKSIDYPKLVPILVKAIQEQQDEIDALKADIKALQAR